MSSPRGKPIADGLPPAQVHALAPWTPDETPP